MSNAKSESGDDDQAAWIDSDDERISVSLASNPRLRKLRLTQSEDIVNGKEYTKRLRRQFQRLYPVPDWANPSSAKQPSSRTLRTSLNSSDSSKGVYSTDEMSLDSDDISTQPLAKILRNITEITQQRFTNQTAFKNLRPEVIDVHRTKDVGLAQRVSPILGFHDPRSENG